MGTSEWIWLIECVLGYLRTQDVILSDLNSEHVATCRDIDMCFRRIKFRHKPLAWQIIVIPHTKKLMLAIECILKLWKVLD